MNNQETNTMLSIVLCFVLSLIISLLIIFHVSILWFYLFILAGIFFFISFSTTDAALIILIFSMLFSPELTIGGIPGRAVVVRMDDILIGIVFLGWMAKVAVKKELGLLRITSLNRPILFYIVTCLAATLLGAMQGDLKLKNSLFYLLKYIEYFLLFFMVANNLRTMEQAKRFVFFMLLTCFLVCIFAWKQLPSGERITAPFEQTGGEPNTFAGYLLLMMSVLMGFIVCAASRKQRMLLLAFLLFCLIPFIFTLSRGGWIGFLASCLALVCLNTRFRFALLIIAVMVFFFFPQGLSSRISDRIRETFETYKTYTVFGSPLTLSESASSRIESWKIGLGKWIKKPILGYGVPSGGVIDNQYTRVLTETGMVGFLVFIWLITRIYSAASQNYKQSRDNFSKGLSLGLLAGLIGLLVQSLSAAVFIIIRIMEPFWFIAAIVVMLPHLETK